MAAPLPARTDSSGQSTPLLKRSPSRDVNPVAARGDRSVSGDSRTPLPKLQLLVLCIMRFSEPVAYLVIFPFVNEMIITLGVVTDPKEVGYYSGFVEGLFAFTQFCTVVWWGGLSDRIGRKPVLLLGIGGTALSMACFGFSSTFWQMVLFRGLSGSLSGNAAVIKSTIGEMTDRTNEALAFPLIPLCWNLGTVAAPAIGGFLSHPSHRFPKLFGSWQLFIDYPYALPCLAGAGIALIGLLVGAAFVKETLPSKMRRRASIEDQGAVSTKPSSTVADYGTTHNPLSSPSSSSSTDPLLKPSTSPQNRRHSIISLIRTFPAVRYIITTYLGLAFVSVSIEAILVLWLYTPLHAGGIGFNVAEIGVILSLGGITSTLSNAIVFPLVQRRVGTVAIYQFTLGMHPILVAMFPIITVIAGYDHDPSRLLTKVSVGALMVFRSLAGIAFTSNMILVNASAPSREYLGVVNGTGQMVASGMRAIGPTISTTLFALSKTQGYLGGNGVWVFIFIVGLAAAYASRNVIDGRDHPPPQHPVR